MTISAWVGYSRVPDMFAPAIIPVQPLNKIAKTEIKPMTGELSIV